MKIAFIHDYPPYEGGGVEVQTYTDACELVEQGHTVCIGTTRLVSETISSNDSRTKRKVPCVHIQDRHALEKLIDESEIVHISATMSLRDGMMNSMKMLTEKKRPYFLSLHTNLSHIAFSHLNSLEKQQQKQKIELFASLIQNDLCKVVGVSNSVKKSIQKLVPGKVVEIIHNAKDWGYFLTENADINILPVNMTYIGELSWMKGMHVLLGALPLIKKEIPDFKMRFIGGGSNKVEIMAIAETLGLGDTMEFLEYTPNKLISSFIQKSDLVILPSLSESWGNILMESLALGVPVIGSRIEGICEVLDDGNKGMLFEAGNPKDLTEKVIEFFKDKAVLEKYSDPKIRESILEHFTIKNRVEKLYKLYLSV